MGLKSVQPFLSGQTFRQISQRLCGGGGTGSAHKTNLTFLVAMESVFEGTLKLCTVPSKHLSTKKQ